MRRVQRGLCGSSGLFGLGTGWGEATMDGDSLVSVYFSLEIWGRKSGNFFLSSQNKWLTNYLTCRDLFLLPAKWHYLIYFRNVVPGVSTSVRTKEKKQSPVLGSMEALSGDSCMGLTGSALDTGEKGSACIRKVWNLHVLCDRVQSNALVVCCGTMVFYPVTCIIFNKILIGQ